MGRYYQNSIRSLNLTQRAEILFPFIVNACAFFDWFNPPLEPSLQM